MNEEIHELLTKFILSFNRKANLWSNNFNTKILKSMLDWSNSNHIPKCQWNNHTTLFWPLLEPWNGVFQFFHFVYTLLGAAQLQHWSHWFSQGLYHLCLPEGYYVAINIEKETLTWSNMKQHDSYSLYVYATKMLSMREDNQI